jgi:hypothetical protein
MSPNLAFHQSTLQSCTNPLSSIDFNQDEAYALQNLVNLHGPGYCRVVVYSPQTVAVATVRIAKGVTHAQNPLAIPICPTTAAYRDTDLICINHQLNL